MTGIKDITASFINNIANLNKEIISIGTDLCAIGEDTGKLLPQLFATYDDCSLDNGTFTRYIEILENQYNDGTLNLESNNLMYKAEVNHNKIKNNINFKGNSKSEYQKLTLKAEIEKLKAAVTKTKYFGPRKGGDRSLEIPNLLKTPPKDRKLYKESNEKTYYWCEGNG